MNDFSSLPPAADFNVAPALGSPVQQQENPFEIFNRIHRLLRGRYIYALAFGAVGALAGAFLGFKATVPKYQSVGLIRIKNPPAKVYTNVASEAAYGATSYARSIAQLILVPRVLDKAMLSDEWKKLERGFSDEARDVFRESLRVETDPVAMEWVYVKFTDAEPKIAQIAVEQVIRSYTDVFGSEDPVLYQGLIPELKSRIITYQKEVENYQSAIQQIGTDIGTTDVELLLRDSTDSLRVLERNWSQLNFQIQAAEKAIAAGGSVTPAPVIEPDLDAVAAEMAKSDEVMRGQLADLSRAQSYLDGLLARGMTEQHRGVISARKSVETARSQVHASARKWLDKNPFAPGGSGVTRISPEQLKADKELFAQISAQRTDAQERTLRLTQVRDRINGFMEQIKKTQAQQADVERRVTQLTSESPPMDAASGSSRINIISYGEVPHRPFSDSRKKLAAFGFLLGGGFPVGLVLLWGLLDRRYRYSDDASSGPIHPTLLGILPYLPDDMSDPEQAAIAAHCVHQIRTLLQISAAQMGKRVFAITSPTSGDGKTSLSMSLALSFASSGANTCLIDFDLIGCGLTSAMNAKAEEGLMNAIEHAELNGQIRQTGFKRLSIVPAGTHDATLVATLSPESVRRIIKQARDKFDVVIIDTGPILGSLEASLVTSAADGVILALGRGQARALADRAMKHLNSVGATLMGVVFNRAQPGDFRRAISSASVRSVPNQGGSGQMDTRALPALGPMARTVARQARQSDDQPHAH